MKELLQNKRKLLYIICIAFLCVIDQRKGSVTGNMQYFWSNCTGLVIAVLIFSHYHFRDFLKKKYFLWMAVSVLGIGGLWIAQKRGAVLPWDNIQLYSALVNIVIYGLLIIRTGSEILSKRLNLRRFLLPGFMCLLLLFMGVSRNDSIWPWYFIMVFGTFAFTDFSETEKKNLAFSLADGLIVGFICVQGAAFVFRPYDVIRYLGMYANPNINGLFYSIVYCAVLVRLYFFLFEYNGKFKKALIAFFMFGAGAMWSFCMMTGCRTGIMSMGIVTCVTGISCLFRFCKNVLLKGSCMVIGLICCIVISFPVVYGCVRYLPAYFHHPVWFFVEYSEAKVHSWDPVDSEKYISFEETIEYIQDRFFGVRFFEKKENELIGKNYGYSLICSTSDAIPIPKSPEYLLPAETEDSGLIRYHIYKYYLSKLNIGGHLNEENGVAVTEGYYAPHAHNLYLQKAFDFGILVGILFIVYVVWSIVHLSRETIASKKSFALCPLLLLVNSCVFGLLEMMWKNGYLAFSIMFLISVFCVEKSKKHPV